MACLARYIVVTKYVSYVDDYNQHYEIEYLETDGLADVTITVHTPYVWGRTKQSFLIDKKLYIRGIVSISRYAIDIATNVVLADGHSQYVDTFAASRSSSDNAKYHFDSMCDDDVEMIVTDGSRWSDVETDTNSIIWGEIGTDGLIAESSGNMKWI